jgi:dipeptidyl aminopeptidase/acylaminoacyl peptidase
MKSFVTGFLLPLFILFANNLLTANGLKPEQITDISFVVEVAVSPDGKYAAYTLYVNRPISDGAGTNFRELHLYDLEKNATFPLITGNVAVVSIGWTPDGSMITYRRSLPETNGMQVFAITPDGKDIQQFTHFDRPVMAYDFINYKTLAITSLEIEEPAKISLKEKGFDMQIFEEELLHIDLWRYDIETQETIQLTRGVTVFDFTVSPDGHAIAAAIAPENTVDASYMFKRVHILEAATGETLEKIENPGKLENMVWSPDGSKLAFRAPSMRADAVSGSLFVLETGTGKKYKELPNLVHGMELSVINMIWQDDNTLLFASEESVDISIRSVNLDNNTMKTVLEGDKACFRGFSLHNDMIVFAGHTSGHPSELMRFDLGENSVERLTNHNPFLGEVSLAQQEKISWSARDGFSIDGVLIYPLDYTEGRKYPLITYIHGGPEAAVQNGWISGYSQWGQFAAAKGFFVFYPNYRASSGRGVDFTMAGFADLLGTEFDDVLDGIDHLISLGYVDPARVGMGGGSYGGYFSAWAATRHTERFAAAVVFVGVTNQVSKRKTTDIPWEDYYVHWGFWTHEEFDKVWGASPMKYAHQSRTPTLILHGDKDPRIPVSQGMELHRALKLHSRAPVRFVLYPGEGHGNAKNTNRYDYLLRTLEWFEHFLIKHPGTETMPAKYPEY